jgi:hypothetical protein
MINICAMFTQSPNFVITEEKEKENVKPETNTSFQLPIQYLDDSHIHLLSNIIAKDLELIDVGTDIINENENKEITKNMYEYVFQPTSLFAKENIPQWKNQFTTDISFLEQTQIVVSTIPDIINTNYEVPCEKIKEIWSAIKHDSNFMDKYGYLEWSILDQFNYSQSFLQAMSICNIISPLLSFIIPFIFLLFPFILLKMKGVPITISMYFTCLTQIAKHHFIGKALSTFQSFSFESFFYLVGSLGLYLLQMYNNTIQCLRFYKNIQFVNDSLCILKEYIDDSIIKKRRFIQYNKDKLKYSGFCTEVENKCLYLECIQRELKDIYPFTVSLYKVNDIGYMLKCFYSLHTNPMYENAIIYSMGFEGYLQNMHGLQQQYSKGIINPVSFFIERENVHNEHENESTDSIMTDNTEKEDVDDNFEEKEKNPDKYIKDQFYPAHQNDTFIVNDANLDNKMIITGPNASGKTTFLKTTALNLIFSQQFGFGFFKTACIQPYTNFHSYLNIPDTSGRDSLFQAESRRCKEILDIINENGNNRHFCIFDELYSGTNPVEATKSAYAFMQYLTEYFPKVDFLLTTHYVDICNKIQGICNYKMQVLESESECEKNNFTFTYKIEPGISRIEGAIHILEEMNYPKEIINMIRST